MSRTYKKNGKGFFRKPKGSKQAKINHSEGNCRNKAIPPNDWDDFRVSKEAQMTWKIAHRMHKQGYSDEKIIDHLVEKYKVTRKSLNWIIKFGFRCGCEACKNK